MIAAMVRRAISTHMREPIASSTGRKVKVTRGQRSRYANTNQVTMRMRARCLIAPLLVERLAEMETPASTDAYPWITLWAQWWCLEEMEDIHRLW